MERFGVGFGDCEGDGVYVGGGGWDAVEEVEEAFFVGGCGRDAVRVFVFAVGVDGVGIADAALFSDGLGVVVEEVPLGG